MSYMKNIRQKMNDYLGSDLEQRLFNTHSVPVRYCYCARLLLQDKNLYEQILSTPDMFDLSLLDHNHPWSQITQVDNDDLQIIEEPIHVSSESLIKCRKCGANTNFSQSQTRSGDEAMTVFIECKNPSCRASYRL